MKELLDQIIPHKGKENTIFFSTLIWFLGFSLYFALCVDFSYHHELMGYDSDFYIGEGRNPKLMLNKIVSWNLRHPLYVMINYPILLIDTLLPSKLHWAIFAIFSSIIMAGSNLLIYKICKQVLIEDISALISVILFSTFAHIMLLSGLAFLPYSQGLPLQTASISSLSKYGKRLAISDRQSSQPWSQRSCLFLFLLLLWQD